MRDQIGVTAGKIWRTLEDKRGAEFAAVAETSQGKRCDCLSGARLAGARGESQLPDRQEPDICFGGEVGA